MSYTTLISTDDLARHLGEPDWAVVDCRFALNDTHLGRRRYLEAHIPGAIYAHLDEDLSGPILPGKTSRHPLPSPEEFAATLSAWGIDGRVQVAAYDDSGGAMAGRLWWMLRWMGHEQVAVLDGDWRLWQREGRPIRSGAETRPPRAFMPQPRPYLLAHADEVLANLHNPALKLLDARSADRYRGENETLDPIAGHIPGAISAPYTGNLGSDGRFLNQEALRARYRALLGESEAREAVFYCGSGVTAAHNALAVLHAGLGDARLYVGSWSEWITDPTRPLASGENP